jgi:hypothetical protein
MRKSFLLLILLVFSFSLFGQNSNESSKTLEITGNIESKGKSNLELADCIANSAMIMGVTSYTESENESVDSAYVNGSYSYSYYVNDYESEAGSISFKYMYEIKDGIISYKFYDFLHDGTGTEFKSIGNLSKKWNSEVGEIFTQKQYVEIMKDLFMNSTNAIRMIKKNCTN